MTEYRYRYRITVATPLCMDLFFPKFPVLLGSNGSFLSWYAACLKAMTLRRMPMRTYVSWAFLAQSSQCWTEGPSSRVITPSTSGCSAHTGPRETGTVRAWDFGSRSLGLGHYNSIHSCLFLVAELVFLIGLTVHAAVLCPCSSSMTLDSGLMTVM